MNTENHVVRCYESNFVTAIVSVKNFLYLVWNHSKFMGDMYLVKAQLD